MLYICKDLASKCFDWRGVGRGAEWRPPNVSNSKNRWFPRDFGSGPHPFDCARVTRSKRLNLRLSKSGYKTGTPRRRPIKGPLSHSASWVYVTADRDDCDERGQRL